MKKNQTMQGIFKVSCFLLVIPITLTVIACKSPHPDMQHFARALAKDLKINVCGGKYVKLEPCGQRNVKFDADLGLCVYINVYGVTDRQEIEELVKFVRKYRGEEYKAIPIEIVFYADLEKSKVVYKAKMKGEK